MGWLFALACVTKQSWEAELSRAVCEYGAECDGVTDVDACAEGDGYEICSTGSADSRQACLDYIEASARDCEFEFYSDEGKPCDWVSVSCWGG